MRSPPKTTGVLQPLDVYAFALLKSKLRTAYQSNFIQLSAGSCSLGVSMMILMDVINDVMLSRSWHDAWDHLGLAGHQRHVSTRVLSSMNVSSIAPIHCRMPTFAELAMCFPLRYDIDVDAAFKGVVTVVSLPKATPIRRLPSSVAHVDDGNIVGAAADSGPSSQLPRALVESASSASTWRPRGPVLHPARPMRLLGSMPMPLAPPPLPPPREEPASRPRFLAKRRRTSWDTSVL